MSDIATAVDVLEKANAKEYEYSCGELGSILKSVPKGKVVYTAVDGDDGFYQYLVVGLHFVNRFAVYIGNDLGFPEGTEFMYEATCQICEESCDELFELGDLFVCKECKSNNSHLTNA